MTQPIPEFRPDWEAIAAKTAAVLLVGSSAGLSALYAWSTGIRHGAALACLSVAMAVALDLAKPLAVSGMLSAGWRRPARAVALGLLAVAAITYSLSAELSLIGTARGDGLADRADATQKAADVRSRRDRLVGELAGIPRARSKAEIDAQIAAILAKHKGASESECLGWQASTADRAACIDVQKLRAEAARAAQRDKLAADLAVAEVALSTAGPVRVADPAAAALVSYGRALGLDVAPETVTQLLLLVPVIALEIGSAFAALLATGGAGAGRDAPAGVGRLPAAAGRQMASQAAIDTGSEEGAFKPKQAAAPSACPDPIEAAAHVAVVAMAPATSGSAISSVEASKSASEQGAVVIRVQPEARLLAVLRDGAGRWAGSQRKLAGSIGLTKSGANVLLSRMARRGQITVKTRPRKGTVVRLAA